MLKTIPTTLLALAIATAAQAEPWTGNADLGWTSNSGNSESAALNAQLGLENENDQWKHALKLQANGSNGENSSGVDETTAEKYSAAWKTDRKLGERSYLFGTLNYSDDRFSGYEFEGAAAIGYGYKVIAEEAMTLMFELGPSYTHSLLSPDNRDPAFSAHVEEVSYRLGEGFSWNFSETSELKQYMTYDGGSDLSTLKVGAYVLTKLSDALSLKVGVDQSTRSGDAQERAEATARANGDSLDNVDTTTYANISYGF